MARNRSHRRSFAAERRREERFQQAAARRSRLLQARARGPRVRGEILGNDLIRQVLLFCDVYTLGTCKKLARYYRTELSSPRFVNEYCATHRGRSIWAVTHVRSDRTDGLGTLRMYEHDLDGNTLDSKCIYLASHLKKYTDGLVHPGESMSLIGACHSIFSFKLMQFGQFSGLLILNLTSVAGSCRLRRHELFGVNSFNAVNVSKFRIVVNSLSPEPNNVYLLQYSEVINGTLRYFDCEVSRDGLLGNGWNHHVVRMEDTLLQWERTHPLAMALSTHLITFRDGNPIGVTVSADAVAKHLELIGHPYPPLHAGGLYHCIGSARYMVVVDAVVADNRDNSRRIFQEIGLHELNSDLNGYEELPKVPNHLFPVPINEMSNFRVFKAENFVCFAVTLRLRSASSYLVYGYNTLTGRWARFTQDHFNQSYCASVTFLTNLSI